ncbi:MAG: response regulator transcription factor [Gammaproteobacteria bacterium]|nr:response regulator transcription factor [Gammaproteobacteria bacterium]
MNKTPIYIISNSSDTVLTKLTIILQSLDMKIKTISLDKINLEPEGIVLIDTRKQEVTTHGVPVCCAEISRKHQLALIQVEKNSVNEYICVQMGIKAVFYADIETDQFLKGLRCLFNGEWWFSRKVLSQTLATLFENMSEDVPAIASTPLTEQLTKREKTIIKLVCQGAKNQEVADSLNISPHTVKTHLYSIFRKTSSRNRVELLNWAKQHTLAYQLLV